MSKGYEMDLELMKAPVAAREAATVILVRDTPAGAGGVEGELEVFAVERNKATRFMGGNIVFPGGKLDEGDAAESWKELTTEPVVWPHDVADGDLADAGQRATSARALAICACRETLEEAGLFLVDGTVDDAAIAELRTRFDAEPDAIAIYLRAHHLRLALDRLIPFARWITPTAEPRRFDTRFFLARAPEGQSGVHDERETVSSLWVHPSTLLARFHENEVQLAPPTYRALELLASARTVAAAEAMARASVLRPICPEVKQIGDDRSTLVLTLPGDPLHSVQEIRSTGATRFVQQDKRWVPQP
jgi:8-oxo-dGTP pyrophosphatase MutT (NUDIX family)